MKLALQRAVDKWIGMPLCALLSAFERVRPPRAVVGTSVEAGNGPSNGPSNGATPRRILVILLSEMGSLVLAYPMFARLKERYPDATLHLLMFKRNRQAIELMNLLPLDNVITIDDSSFSNLVADSRQAITRLRALHLDIVIDCELFARISSIFAYLSNAPVRVGFHPQTQEGLYRGSFINRPVIYNPYRHMSLQLLTLAAATESDTKPLAKYPILPPRLSPPRLQFTSDELNAARDQLYVDFPAVRDKPLILLYPGGGILPIRAWPAQNYRDLATSLLGKGYAVAAIGVKEDKAAAQDIVRYCANEACIDLAGYTKKVRDLLVLFELASLLVANDGAPGQFAALVPVPAIVLFGPETPALYGPNTSNVHCFFVGLPCSPCLTAYNHRSSPCDGDNQCLKQISVADVLAQAERMLADKIRQPA